MDQQEENRTEAVSPVSVLELILEILLATQNSERARERWIPRKIKEQSRENPLTLICYALVHENLEIPYHIEHSATSLVKSTDNT